MQSGEEHGGVGLIRRAAIGATVLAAVAFALTAAGFWLASDPAAEPIAPGWTASVHVLAGGAVQGTRDDTGVRAQFADPFGVAVGPDGLVYVADGAGGNRIRVVDRGGNVTTFAGSEAGFSDGSAHHARFDTPSALAFDDRGMLFVADTGNNAIRRISRDGEVTTVAGGFNAPVGVAVDRAGRVFVADTYNDSIRVIDAGGRVTTLAGGMRGFADGPAARSQFDTPTGLAIDHRGTLYVADTGNDGVRVVTADGQVSTLMDASQGVVRPLGLAAAASGELYVTTEDGRVLERSADASVRVVAGSTAGFRDGRGEDAAFRRPSGIAWQSAGRLVVADSGNAMVRRVGARAPAEPRSPAWYGQPRFDAEAFALQPLLWPLEPLSGPFEVAGTVGEARGEEAGRFHAGVDVRAEQGSPVLAVREAVVQTPLAVSGFGTINEAIRLGTVAYVHVRAGRDRRGHVTDATRFAASYDATGRLVDVRVKRGARFAVGDVVASVNAFNHVHLNIGWPGEEHNPLLFRLPQFRDTVAPTIAAGGIQLFSSDGQRLVARAKRRLVVAGDVRIVVDAWDQADGNRPNRRLGLFELGYQILKPDGTPAPGFESPRMTIRFDRLGEREAPSLVYASGSGIPFYGERRTRFLYIVTNTFRGGRASAGMWRARDLAVGDYTLRVHAHDASGNRAVANRDLPITIVAESGPGLQ